VIDSEKERHKMTQAEIQGLIPVAAPLVVWGVKTLFDHFSCRIPSVIYPPLCAALGMLADWLASLHTGSTASPLTGLVLGAAGVAVREAIVEIKQVPNDVKPAGDPTKTVSVDIQRPTA
jgi:hypothetical protein